ncbi:unnamed protein product [Thlaspi arvense]|uniref:SHSP domain-containing protein n=1 Tax=Thlaspi arvense TaxID=13288 RepID=A0AAU9RMZ5_THLAR|nr:unnamed protein product [Thlaspi arvense]
MYIKKHHHLKKKQSAFQIQASSNLPAKEELNGSLIKRAELESVYHYILNNADPCLIVKTKTLRRYLNGKRYETSEDFPLFVDLFPLKLHPESRVGNRYKLLRSIVFINDPDISCMREDCVERFKRLTGMESLTLTLDIGVIETFTAKDVKVEIDESLEPLEEDTTCLEDPIDVKDEIDEGLEPDTACLEDCTCGDESDVAAKAGAQAGHVMRLIDIGDCTDAYLFRVSLPGVKRDERHFSCEVKDDGKVLIRGITTTGGKQVHRYTQVFEMQTQNLSPPGRFTVSFSLPGPVQPQEFSGNFGTDGVLEGIVMKKMQEKLFKS